MTNKEAVIRGLEDAIGLLTMCRMQVVAFSTKDGRLKGQSIERMIRSVECAIFEINNQNPPVTHCADCIHYTRYPAPGRGWCSRPGAGCGIAEDFFCAGAERKGAESDDP